MKWPAPQVALMVDAFRQFADAIGDDDLAAWRNSLQAHPANLFGLANTVTYDLQYDDAHPAYTSGTWDDGTERPARVRRVRHNPEYVAYPPGCNDDHRKTMLRHVAKVTGFLP